MKKILFQSGKSRYFFFKKLWRFVSERYIANQASQYLRKYPQVAIFSFDYVGYQILLDGRYENDLLELLINSLAAHARQDFFQGAVIDVGANIGNHTLFFSSHFESVLAFEPNPRTYQLLRINTEGVGNVSSFECGLSDRVCKKTLGFHHSNFGGTSVLSRERAEDFSVFDASFSTVDNVVRDLASTRVSLIKIDTEGHEFEVLSGSFETLQRDRPIVVFEQHVSDFSDGTTQSIELLRMSGYTTFGYVSESVYPIFGELLVNNLLLKSLLRGIFGKRGAIVVTNRLRPAFYPLLIAYPREFLNV